MAVPNPRKKYYSKLWQRDQTLSQQAKVVFELWETKQAAELAQDCIRLPLPDELRVNIWQVLLGSKFQEYSDDLKAQYQSLKACTAAFDTALIQSKRAQLELLLHAANPDHKPTASNSEATIVSDDSCKQLHQTLVSLADFEPASFRRMHQVYQGQLNDDDETEDPYGLLSRLPAFLLSLVKDETAAFWLSTLVMERFIQPAQQQLESNTHLYTAFEILRLDYATLHAHLSALDVEDSSTMLQELIGTLTIGCLPARVSLVVLDKVLASNLGYMAVVVVSLLIMHETGIQRCHTSQEFDVFFREALENLDSSQDNVHDTFVRIYFRSVEVLQYRF